MARLVPRAILGEFKIKGLDVDEWQNYVSPDTLVERHTNPTQPS